MLPPSVAGESPRVEMVRFSLSDCRWTLLLASRVSALFPTMYALTDDPYWLLSGYNLSSNPTLPDAKQCGRQAGHGHPRCINSAIYCAYLHPWKVPTLGYWMHIQCNTTSRGPSNQRLLHASVNRPLNKYRTTQSSDETGHGHLEIDASHTAGFWLLMPSHMPSDPNKAVAWDVARVYPCFGPPSMPRSSTTLQVGRCPCKVVR